jgi:cellulose synthase/poly-beta-1,6-N-acetylglucosamine synthase-like glycosyltransferase
MGLPINAVAHDGAWTPESAAYAARAEALGLAFAARLEPGGGGAIPAEAVRRGTVAWCRDGTLAIAPDADKLPEIAAWLARHPALAHRLKVTTPSEIRRALTAANSAEFADAAVNGLHRRCPELSARNTVSMGQAAVLLCAGAATALAVVTDPFRAVAEVGVVATFFFLVMSVFRFAAAAVIRKKAARASVPEPDSTPDHALPVYTILVPLYREAAVVRSLIAALRRIDWPSNRLDIKLVLEEDDTETRAEVDRHLPGPPFEAIVAPNIGPKTKPKALAFAHLFSRGAFVTVYDAEDDPHPRQLREAFARFRAEPDLACVQAPLLVDNPDPTWIARLFAIEYSTLFDGLLPYLASKGLPLPLGGTSNHFRRTTLEEISGWDPYNVTEDADIGLRLARAGHRVGTITLPTYEEAPVRFGVWMRQRTRWFKGWMQTCLVHTRHPLRLARDLGPKRTIGFIAIQLGMVASAVLHPFFIALLIAIAADPSVILARENGTVTAALAAIGLVNLFAGYAAMTTLAGRTLPLRGLRRIETALIWLPLYWLLMSVATYRAMFQLFMRPHYWDKTTHLGFTSRVKPRRLHGAQQPAFSAIR